MDITIAFILLNRHICICITIIYNHRGYNHHIYIYTHNCGASPCRMVLDVERYLSMLDETSPEYSAQPSFRCLSLPKSFSRAVKHPWLVMLGKPMSHCA
jgi:hypothetical protein